MMPMRRSLPLAAVVVCAVAGCADSRDGAYADQSAAVAHNGLLRCDRLWVGRPLPMEARETSGLARSARDSTIFWTHNDRGNAPDVLAISADGRLIDRVRVTGATLIDWEDIEVAPCGDRSCLYIGDIGDNDESREHVTVYRVEEPASGATVAAAEAFHARYPDGPRDAEALFAHGSGDLYIVTKGRSDDVVLYRWPAPRPGEVAVLEPVRVLSARPRTGADRVTAATTTPDGRWVGIRTYGTLYLFSTDELVGSGAARPVRYDLSPLNEAQGEGLAMADDGAVWLSSEAEARGQVPEWSRLQCVLPI
jgi:hypothetical protein